MRTALMAVRELVRLTELAAKISGELQAAKVQVNVNTKPPLSPEDRQQLLNRYLVSNYRSDPGGFIGGIRRAAAEDEVRNRHIPFEEALAELEARERETPPLLAAAAGGDAR